MTKELIKIEMPLEEIKENFDSFLLEVIQLNINNGIPEDDPNLQCYLGFAREIIEVVCRQIEKGTEHVFTRFLSEGCSVFEEMDKDVFFLDLFDKHKDLVLKQNYIPAYVMEEFLKRGHFFPSTANSVVMRMAVAKFITALYGRLLPDQA